jgi:hypothetical protein
MKNLLIFLGIVLLIGGTGIWISAVYSSLQEYEKYCELVGAQEVGSPLPYHVWGGGKYVNITLIVLFFVWIPFLDYVLRKKAYPFFRRKLTYPGIKRFSRSVSRSLYEDLYGLVFGYFTRINRKVRAKIGYRFMKIETFEHLHLLTKVFKWIVFPLSVLYVFVEFCFFGQNALDTMLVGIMLFLYSNFVPDLPAIFRRRIYRDERDTFHAHLSWYKTYALLVFAPLFIIFLFCGITVNWRTTETFHNFKSLAIYGGFLFLAGFLILSAFPISIGGLIEAFCVPLYAILGYLTHLKVDLLF